MAGHLLKSLTDALVSFEYVFLSPLFRRPPTPHLIPLMVQQSHQPALKDTPFNINEIFDGFLWGVPTCRRSVEKRMMRKFGAPNWHNKLILPKKNLKVCGSCGHYHEEKRLCANCYSKVKEETSALQEQMIKEQGLNPIDKEIAILYKGEKQQYSDDFFKDMKVVEVEKPRPKWFSRNLLQKGGPTAELGNNETTAIKPHELG
uniref:Large ribosomal subunit protein bL32m n=1 Tax=Megafenestra aurita TaxID=2291010 RepID=A0A4Y7NIP5_9CRUS|nr:EOG090X0IGM [Megafenestra aurita]SVE92763.1 EOG090X0IGM [Megafenestra aurita]